jgi:hypothetical protein
MFLGSLSPCQPLFLGLIRLSPLDSSDLSILKVYSKDS